MKTILSVPVSFAEGKNVFVLRSDAIENALMFSDYMIFAKAALPVEELTDGLPDGFRWPNPSYWLYKFGDMYISTGYRPVGKKIPADLIKKYEELVKIQGKKSVLGYDPIIKNFIKDLKYIK